MTPQVNYDNLFSCVVRVVRVVSSIVFCCWSYLRNCIKIVIVCPIDYDDWTMTILIWMMGGGGREKDGGGVFAKGGQ